MHICARLSVCLSDSSNLGTNQSRIEKLGEGNVQHEIAI